MKKGNIEMHFIRLSDNKHIIKKYLSVRKAIKDYINFNKNDYKFIAVLSDYISDSRYIYDYINDLEKSKRKVGK